MRKWSGIRTIIYILILMLASGMIGCGRNENVEEGNFFHHSIAEQADSTQSTEVVNDTQAQDENLYLIVGVDQIEETLRLYRYANGMEYRYYYGTGTRFFDKYKTQTTIAAFTPGLLISIGNVNTEGILCDATISDKAWVYDNVHRFHLSTQQNMLEIGESKYRYDDGTYVFSGEERTTMDAIAQGDTLSVVGVDKKILSVRITTAQGTLVLKNTKLFEGSFLQLGNKIFTEITPKLTMQVAEGTYELSVANNGWGGSQEVTIVRGQTTTVDLDKLKGKGPKTGKVRFLIDVADSVLLIDEQETDYQKPVKLTYGQHTIAVYADGYDVWRRNLYVNSKKSTIIINLMDEEDSTQTDAAGGNSQSSQGQSDSTKTPSSETQSTQTDTSDSQNSESEKRQQELDLIKDLLSNMTKSSSLVSN